MEARGTVFLDDEAQAVRRSDLARSARRLRLQEISLLLLG